LPKIIIDWSLITCWILIGKPLYLSVHERGPLARYFATFGGIKTKVILRV
jgi:hypothetical protein